MLKSSVIIDELPTIYFKGLDNLIATARSNKVAVCPGFQDFSQLVRDYGDKEAKVCLLYTSTGTTFLCCLHLFFCRFLSTSQIVNNQLYIKNMSILCRQHNLAIANATAM